METRCAYCGGEGVITAGRRGWVETGTRLREWRERRQERIVYERGRACYSMDESNPIVPMTVELQAHFWRIDPAILRSIEAGQIEPSPVVAIAHFAFMELIEGAV